MVDEPIFAGGPPAYFVTMPVREILSAIKLVHVPVELSLSAVTFICNQVLYAVLYELSQRKKSETFNLPTWAGFIHLPLLPEEVTTLSIQCASMGLETSVRGIRAALEKLSALERS